MVVRAWSLTCRVLGAITIAGLFLAVLSPVAPMVARRVAIAPDVGAAEAIVVLGASVNGDGSLTDASLRRAIAGIRLYHEKLAPRLVLPSTT